MINETTELWPDVIVAASEKHRAIAEQVAAIYKPGADVALPTMFRPHGPIFGNCAQTATALWVNLQRAGIKADLLEFMHRSGNLHMAVRVGDTTLDASSYGPFEAHDTPKRAVFAGSIEDAIGKFRLLPEDTETREYLAGLMTANPLRPFVTSENRVVMRDCPAACRVEVMA